MDSAQGDALADLATSIFLEYMYDAEAYGLYVAAPSSKAGTGTAAYKESIANGGMGSEAKDVSATYLDGVLSYDPAFANSYRTVMRLPMWLKALLLIR